MIAQIASNTTGKRGSRANRPSAGTIKVSLKQVGNDVALLTVNSAGKVARIAQVGADGSLHVRPDNAFFNGINVDDEGYMDIQYDDLTPEPVATSTVSAQPKQDFSAVIAASKALTAALEGLGQ